MQTRREVMQALVASAAIPVATTSQAKNPATIEIFRRSAGDLANSLQELCGGQWRVSVDKNLEFVLISKVL